MIRDIGHGNSSSVFEATLIAPKFKRTEDGFRWYRSKDKNPFKYPFGSYMLNKKWTLEEEFNNHLLRFQQVDMRVIFISF